MTTEIKYLTEDETQQLFQAINNDSSRYALRNQAIFHLAKYCALRVSEIALLRCSDYSWNHKHIYCRRQKGSCNNTLRIIDPYVLFYLEEYIYNRNKLFPYAPSDIMFPSQFDQPISRKTLDHMFKSYCAVTKIPRSKQHFHTLKHTRAIELVELGVRIEDVQWWLGHKNISNTQIYAQYTTKLQEALYHQIMRTKGDNSHD